jgi:hypothetical protein
VPVNAPRTAVPAVAEWLEGRGRGTAQEVATTALCG